MFVQLLSPSASPEELTDNPRRKSPLRALHIDPMTISTLLKGLFCLVFLGFFNVNLGLSSLVGDELKSILLQRLLHCQTCVLLIL